MRGMVAHLIWFYGLMCGPTPLSSFDVLDMDWLDRQLFPCSNLWAPIPPRAGLLQIACDTDECGFVAKNTDCLKTDRRPVSTLCRRQRYRKLSVILSVGRWQPFSRSFESSEFQRGARGHAQVAQDTGKGVCRLVEALQHVGAV